MGGAASRRRGHGWEVRCSQELSGVTGQHVVTGRFFGLTYGADLVTVTGYDQKDRPVTYDPEVCGWSVECKAVKARNPKGWLTQATEQSAPGLRPVVLWTPWSPKAKRAWEDASAFVWDANAPRGWWEMPIREWVKWLRPKKPHVDDVADRIMADRLGDGYY